MLEVSWNGYASGKIVTVNLKRIIFVWLIDRTWSVGWETLGQKVFEKGFFSVNVTKSAVSCGYFIQWIFYEIINAYGP